jgi:hypothetical protein
MSVLAASVLRATARRTLTVSTLSVTSSCSHAAKRDSCQISDIPNIEQTTTPSRLISSSSRTQNNATAVPIADAVRNVAQRAQEGVMMKAGEEGFKSGVLATLLGGSALTAAYLIFSLSNGKTVNANELL